mmetsp:Transcript_98024/g.277862  ORF Transcript_98024/g.277862 Transcript_98024/m.277862 type:complete len:90 (+) Transcript_98024:647-916(+)
MYNTPACWRRPLPACFTTHVMGEYLMYAKKVGGPAHRAAQPDIKSRLVYATLDGSGGVCPAPGSCQRRPDVARPGSCPAKPDVIDFLGI